MRPQCRYHCENAALCQARPGPSGYCFYHEKVMVGLLEEVSDILDDAAIDAMMDGRRRYDQRRLDNYVIDGDGPDPA